MDLAKKLNITIAKKQAIFAQMNNLYDISKNVNFSEMQSIQEYLANTCNLDKLYAQFNDLCDEANVLEMEINPKFVPNFSTWSAFETIFSYVTHVRSSALAKSKPACDDAKATGPRSADLRIKLPPIEIPSFNGQPEHWSLFYESFKTNIQDNPQLSDAQRVHYLVGKLSGTALAVFAGIVPNAENYPQIWKALVTKYQDKRALGTMYLNKILNLKQVSNTAVQLNEFIERFSASISALKQLGISDLADFIFMHFAQKRLDPQLVQAFELHVRANDMPHCSDLVEYIRHQVKVLERTTTVSASRSATHSTTASTSQANNYHNKSRNTFQNSTSHAFALTNSELSSNLKCLVCKGTNHFSMYECPQFKAMPVKARYDYVKNNKYCTNCLSYKHTNSRCNSSSRCKLCNQKHHSLIHFDSFKNNAPLTAATIGEPLLTAQSSSSHPPAAMLPCVQSPFTQLPCVQQPSMQPPCVQPTCGHVQSPQLPPQQPLPTQPRPRAGPAFAGDSVTYTCQTQSVTQGSEVILSTAKVHAMTNEGYPLIIRCILDSASQNHLITTACCKKLKLNIKMLMHSTIRTVGSLATNVQGYVSLKIKSRFSDDTYNLQLLVVDTITERLPMALVNTSKMRHLSGLPLADDTWYIPGEIEIILGAQLFPHLLLGGRVSPVSEDSTSAIPAPPALETTLGYVIMGRLPTLSARQDAAWSFGPITNDELNNNLKRFWELEELPDKQLNSPEDFQCEELYRTSISRDSDGKYLVALPFKRDPAILGNSFTVAKRRLMSLEKKFRLNPDLRKAYNDVIKDYIDKGYLSELTEPAIQDGYIIPHHAVIRLDKTTTKTRVVLDASAKTDTDVSLNDCLHIGPNLQADLFTLLINFRLFEIAISADIQQMYLRILVLEDHRKFQKILFRFNDEEPIRVFQFNSVTFGLRSSPYLAMRTVRQLANDERERFPHAANVATRELYMDDLTTSVATLDEGIRLSRELIEMFNSGGFKLVKWASNSIEMLANVPESYRAPIEFTDNDNLKVLGLKWLPVADVFTFSTSATDKGCSKRAILSTVARLFDILGLVAPVILCAKLLIQELWLAKVGWDDEPSESIVNKFNQIKDELPLLERLRIPRHLSVAKGCTVNLLAFGDASQKAYGCVIYLHVTQSNGNVDINIVSAKSRVAPLKTISLARLELCAALLLSELLKHVHSSYNDRYKIDNVFAFSDSTIALSWIHSSPHRWQQFVANRVNKIHENLSPDRFFHINGGENPSDCVSRGLLPSQIIDHPLWWRGPSWALCPAEEWPVTPFTPSKSEEMPELKGTVTLTATLSEVTSPLYELALRVSSWQKLLRIVVYVLRFLKKLPRSTCIIASDLNNAEKSVLCSVQKKHFNVVIYNVQKGKLLPPPLRKLNIFLDGDLLRVGGRLKNADIPYENRHPILLPHRDHVVNLIIEYLHRTNCHTRGSLLMSLLRQRYWILAARRVIRQRTRECNFCFKCAPTNPAPVMADLPPSRVQEAKAFTHTGLDYAGPFNITLARHRGIRSQKAYICLFVCLVTKAIHIELVSELSTDAFLDAFKRFIARRGAISCLYSDNATNFIGAKRHLGELYDFLNSRELQDTFQSELSTHRISWKMIPPRAPHFGGLWESNIKAMKSHLYRVIGVQILCYEEMLTVLTQIESLLNSRPLCVLSDEPEPTALTPAHFLMSTPIQHLPAYPMDTENINLRDRKRLLDQLVQSYWKRWHLDYLHTLQVKQKWNTPALPVAIGTVVLVHQDDVPPLRWPLGVIQEVFPGKDGVIRVASVRTQNGAIFKRPVVKLCPLPTQ